MSALPHETERPSAITRRGLLSVVGVAGLSLATSPHIAQAKTSTAPTSPAPPTLPMTILLRGGLPDDEKKRITDLSPDITLTDDGDALATADAIFGGLDSAELKRAEKLKWVQFPAAGVEGILTPEFVESDVTLTNAKGCYGPEIAEHTLGLLLSLTRGIAQQTRRMSTAGEWGYDGPQPLELRGMTMGIIGLGGIGREIARRAKAMDMKVIAVDAEPLQLQQLCNVVDEVHLVDDGLDALLSRSNVLVSAAPLTARTIGMLGADQFSRLPKGAFFINVSRGRIAQTDALVEALKRGHLAGAGLDVTDPEPLPKGHALWTMPNVVITSHIAGKSPQGTQRVRDLFVENVRRCARGLPLLNVVDKRKGY